MHAQWAPGGILGSESNPWTGDDPIIEQAADPFLRFKITDTTPDNNDIAGLHFLLSSDASDGRLFFKYSTDEWFLDDDSDLR